MLPSRGSDDGTSGPKTNYTLNFKNFLTIIPILDLKVSLDRAYQDLNFVSGGNLLGVTHRTSFSKFAPNFILFSCFKILISIIDSILPSERSIGGIQTLKINYSINFRDF